MMWKTRSLQEAQETLFKDKRLLKESWNNEQNKEGGIMKEIKIRIRQFVVVMVGRVTAVKSKQYDTLNMMDVLKGKMSELEKRQIEENKIKEAQKGMKEEQGNTPIHFVPLPFERKLLSPEESTLSYSDVMAFQRTLIERIFIGRLTFESMMYSPEEIRDELRLSNSEFEMTVDLKYLRSRVELADPSVYFRGIRRDCLDCRRDHLRLCTESTLMYIGRKLKEFLEDQLGHQQIFRKKQRGQQLFFLEDQLGHQQIWDPFEEKMGIRSILFQGGQSRRKLFERRTKTKLHGILENCLKRGGNAVVEDDVIIEREKLTDVTEELSGEFDDEEKEKRELEQLLRCKVCLDSDACVVLFPCRHMATCEYCEGFLQCCPVCRSFIDEAVKVNEEN